MLGRRRHRARSSPISSGAPASSELPTTGAASRRQLQEFLAREMARNGPLAVAFFDLDHFRRVNDCLGHSVGDLVLHAMAERLKELAPTGSLIAHFGADIFVAVLVGVAPERDVQLVWEMVSRLANPMFVAGHELRFSVTAGLARRDAASTPESVGRDADAALTRAKATQRGGVEVFSERMRVEAVERLRLDTGLRHATERGELSLHLQPVVRLETGRAEGSEALLRWTTADGTPIGPATFIPMAEEAGLILSLGEWVLTNAVSVLERNLTPRLSVNLSPRQLLDPGLPGRVERLLGLRNVPPQALSFEVTETVLIENLDLAADCMNSLRHLGCAVGLDDFGTGYSSLGYLRRLPVDFLKLDYELVKDIDRDPQAARVAETILSLARSLSLATIGEGVERQSQADALRDMGCHYGQGWLFGRPAPAGPS